MLKEETEMDVEGKVERTIVGFKEADGEKESVGRKWY